MKAVKKALGFKVPPERKKVIYMPLKDLNFDAKTQVKEKLDKLKKGAKNCDALLVGVNVGPF